jgi:Holliday junction resolvase RusA-like endonuclease
MRISLFVPGIPKPGGSKRGFNNAKLGRVLITEDCKASKSWRAVVSLAARQAYRGDPLVGPLEITVAEKLKPAAPKFHTVKPDATKLMRSTEDALTGILWRDDAQIARQTVEKSYGECAGAWITVEQLEPLEAGEAVKAGRPTLFELVS